MKVNYKTNPNWKLYIKEDKLMASQGADSIYWIDEVPIHKSQEVLENYTNNQIESLSQNDPFYQNLFNNFKESGILVPSQKDLLSILSKFIQIFDS